MLNVLETKAVALSVMAILTLCFSLLPLLVRRLLLRSIHQDKSQTALTGCLCFGAGVLLSIVFVHLLPETRETYQDAMNSGFMKKTSFPVAEVVLCCGFFLVYLMEEIIHTWINHRSQLDEVEVTHEGPTTFEDAKEMAKLKRLPVIRVSESRHSTGSHIAVMSVMVLTNLDGKSNEMFEGDDYSKGDKENDANRHNVHTIPHCHHSSPVDNKTSVMGAVVVVVALSFHGIMEGLALGLESTNTGVWILFGAMSAHKFVIGFSMAMELLEVGVPFKPFLASMIIFSLAAPLGCLFGCLVLAFSTGETAVGLLLPNVLQSVAGGTVLYITFCEVLERERTKPLGGWVRFLTLLIGFFVMVGLESLEAEDTNLPTTNATTIQSFTTLEFSSAIFTTIDGSTTINNVTTTDIFTTINNFTSENNLTTMATEITKVVVSIADNSGP